MKAAWRILMLACLLNIAGCAVSTTAVSTPTLALTPTPDNPVLSVENNWHKVGSLDSTSSDASSSTFDFSFTATKSFYVEWFCRGSGTFTISINPALASGPVTQSSPCSSPAQRLGTQTFMPTKAHQTVIVTISTTPSTGQHIDLWKVLAQMQD